MDQLRTLAPMGSVSLDELSTFEVVLKIAIFNTPLFPTLVTIIFMEALFLIFLIITFEGKRCVWCHSSTLLVQAGCFWPGRSLRLQGCMAGLTPNVPCIWVLSDT